MKRVEARQTVTVELGERGYDIVIGAGLIDEAGAAHRQPSPGRALRHRHRRQCRGRPWRKPARLARRGRHRTCHARRCRPARPQNPSPRCKPSSTAFSMPGSNAATSSSRLAAAWSAISPASPPRSRAGAWISCRCRPRCWPRSIPRSAARPASTSPQGKNLVGAFHQPLLVLADTGALDDPAAPRIPRRLCRGRQIRADRPAGFLRLARGKPRGDLCVRSGAGRGDRASCRAKAEIVAADETEEGRRALLNLGHTFAHALEGGDRL